MRQMACFIEIIDNNDINSKAFIFLKDKFMSEGNQDKSIFIGTGVVFKGSINAPNQAIISGTVEGELVAKDVLIGAAGVVTGTTQADFIDVKGELNQSITSKNVLIVRNTGKVTGDVTYGEIEIERGGKVTKDLKTAFAIGTKAVS
jgi:cytoskeletal protein CcmA (bactofilin family)